MRTVKIAGTLLACLAMLCLHVNAQDSTAQKNDNIKKDEKEIVAKTYKPRTAVFRPVSGAGQASTANTASLTIT
jgi:hypothetical protein